jgi:hypothetical protein
VCFVMNHSNSMMMIDIRLTKRSNARRHEWRNSRSKSMRVKFDKRWNGRAENREKGGEAKRIQMRCTCEVLLGAGSLWLSCARSRMVTSGRRLWLVAECA